MSENDDKDTWDRVPVPLVAASDDSVAEALRDLYTQLPGYVVGGVEYLRIEATKSYLEHMQAIRAALAPYGLFKEWCLTAGLNYWALHKALSRAYGDVLPDARPSHSKLAIDAASTDRLLRWFEGDEYDDLDPDDLAGGERVSDEQLYEWNKRDAADSLRWGWWQNRVRRRVGERAYKASWARTFRAWTRSYVADEGYGPLTPYEADDLITAQRAMMDVEREEAAAAGLVEIAEYSPALNAAIEAALTPDRVRRIAIAVARYQRLGALLGERYFPSL